MTIEVTYSPYDGGWYAEVFDASTGRTLHQTAVCRSKVEAIEEARIWINKH